MNSKLCGYKFSFSFITIRNYYVYLFTLLLSVSPPPLYTRIQFHMNVSLYPVHFCTRRTCKWPPTIKFKEKSGLCQGSAPEATRLSSGLSVAGWSLNPLLLFHTWHCGGCVWNKGAPMAKRASFIYLFAWSISISGIPPRGLAQFKVLTHQALDG